jgi:hypothetical protein
MSQSLHDVAAPSSPVIAAPRKSNGGVTRCRRPMLVLALLAAALAHQPSHAQPTAAEAGPTPTEEPSIARPTLKEDLKAFATAPAHWRAREWLRFSGVVAAIGAAYRDDEEIRARHANDGEPDYHEVADSMPAALAFGGTWFAAKLAHSEEAQSEVLLMRRAIVVQTISSEVIKVALRRERPGPGVPKDHWFDGNLSFPSGHTAAAFAVGTVLAESGDDHRWLRRVVGYGIGVATGYQRINHDAHWFSDTVAGAALGIWAAKFVMKRHEGLAARGQVSLTPLEGGAMLSYTVPIK